MSSFKQRASTLRLAALVLVASSVVGCGGGSAEEQDRDFHTSGSREADQRADQRMAKQDQLTGGNNNGGQKIDKASGAQVAEDKKTLYERLGSDGGVQAIVDDVVTRWVADPQVNFERKGVTKGGLSFSRGQSEAWDATGQTLATVKKNLSDFVGLKTGGPTVYNGPEFSIVAKDRHVTNAEFDAAVGDLKASLDKLQIANQEQKELLAVMEAARTQIVTER